MAELMRFRVARAPLSSSAPRHLLQQGEGTAPYVLDLSRMTTLP